jgi:hypothetical protein
MGRALCVALAVVASGLLADARIVMVQTLTRHGERAPDKVVCEATCRAIWPDLAALRASFGALPGRLTPLGVQHMKDVGVFLRARYVSQLQFMSGDYQTHLEDWDFVAREGFRQQRSMSGISLGLFPDTPVPVNVQPRETDAILGGPAPACADFTAKMIVKWHAGAGREVVERNYAQTVAPFERFCNVSLRKNPVNAVPGGANPHAWIGDVSDSMDSAFAGGVQLPAGITPQLHEQLTDLSFELEQDSHFSDPRGATMFAGDFPDALLDAFEAWRDLPAGKARPKGTPLMRLYACSRELHYGLTHLFGWAVDTPGQPKGRVTAGTTFMWELHNEGEAWFVRSLWWNPGMAAPAQLQPDAPLHEMRKAFEDYIAEHGGPWQKLCDFKSWNAAHGHHEPGNRKFVNPATIPVDHANMADTDAQAGGLRVVDDAVTNSAAASAAVKEKAAAPSKRPAARGWMTTAAIFAIILVVAVGLALFARSRGSGYQRI